MGPVPASDISSSFCPVGLTKRKSTSAGQVWLNPFSFTVVCVIVPPSPVTLITEGYGEPAPWSGTVTGKALVNESVPAGEGKTFTEKAVLLDNGPSETVTVIVAVPVSPTVGRAVTVRLAPLPPKVMFASGTRNGSEVAADSCRFPGAISLSPTVNASGGVACPS